jgi:hypothetical protein
MSCDNDNLSVIVKSAKYDKAIQNKKENKTVSLTNSVIASEARQSRNK